MQTWVEGLVGPDELGGRKVPMTWVTLKRIPLEIRHWAPATTANLGHTIGVDTGKCMQTSKSLAFCIALHLSNGYENWVGVDWKNLMVIPVMHILLARL